MSRWSRREAGSARGPRPNRGITDRRAETEPLVALVVVVFAVAVALVAYAGVLETALVPGQERDVARPTLHRVHDALAPTGVVAPSRLPDAADVGPDGYRLRITLFVEGSERQLGPEPPADASAASRPASVRVRPGVVRPGRLAVEVWR